MTSTTFLVAALAVGTAACSGGDSETAADTSAMATTATTPAGTVTDSGMTTGTGTGVGAASSNNLNDPSTVTQLDAVVSAAQSGLTSLPANAAIAAIDPLREKLHNSGQPNLESIADDLDQLRDKLDDTPVNGREIGTILSRIGPKVTTASTTPGAPASLKQLGTALTEAGTKLGGSR